MRKSFGLRKKEGVIREYIAGEDFSIFNETVLALLEAVSGLRGDPDLGATNEGVSILADVVSGAALPESAAK